MNLQKSEIIVQELKNNVVPAIGCTEPIAVALACAKGASVCSDAVERIHVVVDTNTFKNAFSVRIPGLKEAGLKAAAAIGAIRSNPEKGLMVLEDVNQREIYFAKRLVTQKKVEVEVDNKQKSLYIQVKIYSAKNTVTVRIERAHARFSFIELNGNILLNKIDKHRDKNSSFMKLLSQVDIAEIIELIECIDISDLDFLMDGFEMVEKAVAMGLTQKNGIGYGTSLKYLLDIGKITEDIVNYVKIRAAAAGDARMAGESVPVMTSFGSGNQGILIYIVLDAVARNGKTDREQLIRALALSHIIVAVSRYFTGLLSPNCGCTLGAGAAAAVGTVYLKGGTLQEIDNAFRLFVANSAGVICDGAKESCAQKISSAAASAVENAYLAFNCKMVPLASGIIGKDCKDTLENIRDLTYNGMQNISPAILTILLNKNEENYLKA